MRLGCFKPNRGVHPTRRPAPITRFELVGRSVDQDDQPSLFLDGSSDGIGGMRPLIAIGSMPLVRRISQELGSGQAVAVVEMTGRT